jgi:hypothetical protein
MKRSPKKLTLSRETLGNLEERQMKVAVGGTAAATNCVGCDATVTQCSNCCTRTNCTNCCP